MIYYYSDQLKNYITQLKRQIMEQTGQVYERDLVNDIRKYWYRGKSHFRQCEMMFHIYEGYPLLIIQRLM